MTIWAWLLLSIPLGAMACIVLLNFLLKTPASRIWLNERLSWTNQTLPPHCHALVRHGKWVAKHSQNRNRILKTRYEPKHVGKAPPKPIPATKTLKRP